MVSSKLVLLALGTDYSLLMNVLAIHCFVLLLLKSVVCPSGCSLGPVRVRISGSLCVGVNGIVWLLGCVVGAYYGWWGFKSMSKILFGESSGVSPFILLAGSSFHQRSKVCHVTPTIRFKNFGHHWLCHEVYAGQKKERNNHKH